MIRHIVFFTLKDPREAADAWRESLRTEDMIARFGGEEFVVLMADASRNEVETVIDGTTSATNAAWAGVHSVQDLATVSYHWTADVVVLGAAQTIALARNTYSWTATQVDQGATAIADATSTGYQATRDLAGNTYSWTAATTSTSVAAVSAVAVGSYGAVMAGAASQIDTLAAWLWPTEEVIAEANVNE